MDGGDFGDSYNYAPPASDRWSIRHRPSPWRSTWPARCAAGSSITRRFDWPAGVLEDGSARTAELEATDVAMEVELRADEPFLRVGIAFVNHSDDHRVRFHAPIPRRPMPLMPRASSPWSSAG